MRAKWLTPGWIQWVILHHLRDRGRIGALGIQCVSRYSVNCASVPRERHKAGSSGSPGTRSGTRREKTRMIRPNQFIQKYTTRLYMRIESQNSRECEGNVYKSQGQPAPFVKRLASRKHSQASDLAWVKPSDVIPTRNRLQQDDRG